MTTSAFETVRSIPLIVERDVCAPMPVDSEDSGFPFDSDFDREDRGDPVRSQLDDLALRHPELAEHLEGFPFRSDSLGRRSRPPRPSDEFESRRFGGRPFGSSRFERFGFPFARDPFEEDHQRGEEPKPDPPREQPEQPKKEESRAPERSRRGNIQQSNTVDLGQKQEPVNDRNQRSMSAPPPDNRSGQQRFVSSINIPINRDGSMGDMGTQQSQPQQQEKQANKPTERVIPIHVEGRDEPVMPKHTGPSFSQPQPQPERIFGHRPSQFTQYVGRESPRPFATGPEWHHPAYSPAPTDAMKQQQQQYQQAQQQKFQQQQQQQKPEEPEVSPPPQPPKPATPIDIIQSIQKDVSELMGQVEKFSGVPRDKQYLYLDEMLTRNLIKLDNVDTQGQENIRQARKEAIKCIESCIGILEAKAAANVPKEEKSDEQAETRTEEAAAEESQQPQVQDKMEVEVKPENKPESEEKMEVVNEAAEPSKENPEQKPEEDSQQGKTDEVQEDKQADTEITTGASQEDDKSEEKKEKKKGKKKELKSN